MEHVAADHQKDERGKMSRWKLKRAERKQEDKHCKGEAVWRRQGGKKESGRSKEKMEKMWDVKM